MATTLSTATAPLPIYDKVGLNPSAEKKGPVGSFGRSYEYLSKGVSTLGDGELRDKHPALSVASMGLRVLIKSELSFARSHHPTNTFSTKDGMFSRFTGFAVTEDLMKGLSYSISMLFETVTLAPVFHEASFSDRSPLKDQIVETYNTVHAATRNSPIWGRITAVVAIAGRAVATVVSMALSVVHIKLNFALFLASKVTALVVGSIVFIPAKLIGNCIPDSTPVKSDQDHYASFIKPSPVYDDLVAKVETQDPEALAEAQIAHANIKENLALIRDTQNDTTFDKGAASTLRRNTHLETVVKHDAVSAILLNRFVKACQELPDSMLHITATDGTDRHQPYWDLFCTQNLMVEKYNLDAAGYFIS